MLMLPLYIMVTMNLVPGMTRRISPPRIAIIGGGIGGASVAYYTRDLFGPDTQIDLYEANKVGGRLAVIEMDGLTYEGGATIIHPKNTYMVNFTKLLGMKARDREDSRLGVFNGKEMVFTGSDWGVVTMAKMFWQYGWDVMRLKSHVDQMITDFSRVYNFQEEGRCFTQTEKLLEAMSPRFPALLYKSTKQAFKEQGFQDLLIDQIGYGAMMSNYGQSHSIQAFVGGVSLAGATPGLWSVHGGNHLVASGIIEKADINVNTAVVNEITYVSLGAGKSHFHLEAEETNGKDIIEEEYDVIFVATPLHDPHAKPQFKNFKNTIREQCRQAFHQTVATYVRGKPNNAYFGLGKKYRLRLCVDTTA